MEIRHLRSFVHVAELRSLTRAAAFLRISQPAISRQMRLLEAELKTTLFHRHGHGVTLTHAGELLFERSTALLTEFENLRQDIAAPGRKGVPSAGSSASGCRSRSARCWRTRSSRPAATSIPASP